MVKTVDSLSPVSLQNDMINNQQSGGSSDFFQILKDTLNDANDKQIKSDKAVSDIATGRVRDLHSAAITIGKAELSMKVMLEVRNKALNAYKEILKTPI